MTHGGFVPLGAKRADGSPHPHAGTGFGLYAALGCPVKLVNQADTHIDLHSDIWPTSSHRGFLDIYRSTDEGASWTRVMHEKVLQTDAPLIIGRALDGTVYFATNRHREPLVNRFARCEMIWLWPLSDDRSKLLDPVVVRDGPVEWGPSPTPGSIWRVDHPVGTNLRLADGWRHILTYRGLEDAEMRTDAGPTPHTGSYVEEIRTAGPVRVEHDWRF